MSRKDAPGVAELVERHGTPLFVQDGDEMEIRAQRLLAALPEACDVHYAVKANPSLGVLALLRSQGLGAEIASVGELRAVQAAGFAPERVIYAGPGKRDEELRAAVEAGIHAIHVESEGELMRLAALARELGVRVRVGLRVHVPWTAGEAHRIIGGGEATKFGISREQALARLPDWLALEGLDISGLHVFNASNVLDAEALLEGAARTFELARELVEAGMKLSWLDIGGGLGISYAADGVELDVERFGAGLSELLADLREDTGLPVRLVLEPGRYLVGPAGRYVTRIVDQKSCASVDFLVVDGGVHHLLRPALVGQAHPIRPVGAHASAALRPQRVVGPLCTSLDSFGDHDLPTLDVGELVAVEACGAYGFTEAMPGFLSHAVPAELMVWRGEAHVLRERKEVEAHLEGQSIPAGLREASAS